MKKLLAVLLAAVGLSTVAIADGNPPHHKAVKQDAWATAPSKPSGSGVRLRYEVPARLNVGQTATVRLRFDRVAAEGARVELKAPPGVTMTLVDGGDASGVALPRGRDTTLELRVTPQTDGVHYIDVITTQDGRGGAQSVALKVGTGAPQLKQHGAAQTTPSGEKVISLPAQR